MKLHEQRDALIRAIEIALPYLTGGPSLGAFGIAREDCALVHMDYFGGVDMAAMHMTNTLAAIRNQEPHEVSRELGLRHTPCDCRSCAGKEAAARSRELHVASYSNVAAWKVDPTERDAIRPNERGTP